MRLWREETRAGGVDARVEMRMGGLLLASHRVCWVVLFVG